jgi:hypothetical protein
MRPAKKINAGKSKGQPEIRIVAIDLKPLGRAARIWEQATQTSL